MNKRILIVTNIPTPYRIPFFNLLSERLIESGRKLIVLFAARNYKRRMWQIDSEDMKFEHYYLDEDSARKKVSFKGLFRKLHKLEPDLIISSGLAKATFITFVYSTLYKIPYLIWNGSIRNKNAEKIFIKKVLRKLLVKYASGYIVYGSLAKEYLAWLGAPLVNIHIALNTVDTEFFRVETDRFRKELKKDSKSHLLFLGELNERKDVKKILDAAAGLKKIRNDFVLDIVGDGPDLDNLKLYSQNIGTDDCVIFHGYKQKNELPYFFAMADLFLFPTKFDIWGLVLNEAMSAGLPCLVSINAGAANDLIRENETGLNVNFNSSDDVIKIIFNLLSKPETANRLGNNAKNFIMQSVTLEKSIEGFIRALEKI